jgi:serine/threonine protein kinase
MTPERWQQVKVLLAEVMQAPSSARASVLDRACSGDSALRTEVESLLDAGDAADTLFETPPLSVPAMVPGMRLGNYEIVSFVAAGGMGEVYRGRDLVLRRDVAIKVLPPLDASDRHHLWRFDNEARTTAAINHPNVVAVYDVSRERDVPYIVTELLEGKTLREALGSDGIPLRKALDYSYQIANGLAAAHEKGVIHRDLKPENIFVTREGRIKILDFGLAKLVSIETKSSMMARTVDSQSVTKAGAILGTVGYMAPEQVRGITVTPRSDLFAFGAVLFEMLSGQRAFRGESSIETLAAVLQEDPLERLTALPQVPLALEAIVRRCLEKDADQRFQCARDLSFAIQDLAITNAPLRDAELQRAKAHSQVLAVGALFAFIVTLSFLVFSVFHRSPLPKYTQLTFRKGYIDTARFAADGQTVIYDASWEQKTPRLYSIRADGTELRTLDLPPAQLRAVSTAGDLVFTLGWFGERLARAPLSGGGPRILLDDVEAADWSPQGQLAVVRKEDGKSRLEYPIGRTLYETIGWFTDVRFSPDGDVIAFMLHPIRGDDRGTVMTVDVRGTVRTLTREWSGEGGLAWYPNGREIWFTATTNREYERALNAVTTKGKLRIVARFPGSVELKDISSDGRVLLARRDRRFEVVVSDFNGNGRQFSWSQMMRADAVSVDGKSVVVTDFSGSDYSFYLAPMEGGSPVLLGPGVGSGISPDNRWVSSILPSDTGHVQLISVDSNETRTISAPNFKYRSAKWTSDGRQLLVRASEGDKTPRVWIQGLDGSLRALTPEGVDGELLTVNGVDYVSTGKGSETRLYPAKGGPPRTIAGLESHDEVFGGSNDADVVYVTPNNNDVPMQIFKVFLKSGIRKPFMSVHPIDAAGILAQYKPIYLPGEKQYIDTQVRDLSILFVASDLK